MSENNNNEFDMDPEYLMKQLNKKRGTGKPAVSKDNDVVLTAPAPKKSAAVDYDPDDDEISAEEYARLKARYSSGTKTSSAKKPAAASSAKRTADGSVRRTSADGTVRRSADGTVRRSSDGTVRRSADGTVRRSADGTVRRSADGTVRRSADGTERKSADGTVRRSADGTVRRSADGTVRRSADGTVRRTRPQGETGTKRSSEMAKRYRERERLGREEDSAERNGRRPASARGTKKPEKKRPVFWIGLGIWAAFLLLVGIILVHHVKKSLVRYEASQPDNVIEGFVYDFKDMILDGSIAQKIELPEGSGEFEDKMIFSNMYASNLKNIKSLTYARDKKSYDSSAPIYDIYADDKLVAKMTLKSKNAKTVIKMLTVCDWEIGKIEPVFSAVTKDYTITVPDNYKVKVNGIDVTDKHRDGDSVENNTLAKLAEYVQLPSSVTYKIKGLVNAPEIKIYDAAGAEVSFTPDEHGNVNVAFTAESGEVTDEIKTRALDNLKTWQNFLNAELSGAEHGLADVQAFLLKDSVYWQQAKEYAGSVDITFVSDHNAANNTYAEQTVDDYVKYTDNCYSVHVVLDKKMVLTRTGETVTDKIDTTLFYIYYDDSDDGTDNPHWVIADMVATTNKK